MKKIIEEKRYTFETAIIVLSGTALVALATWSALTYFSPPSSPDELAATATLPQAQPLSPFENLSIEARAVYVRDVAREEVLYAYNDEAQLPLASLTKLMTALVAHELLGDAAVVTIDGSAIAQEGDSGFGLFERFDSRTLLDFMLLESSNDGAYALAAAAAAAGGAANTLPDSPRFVDRMNRRAQELGLAQTYFFNPTGLDNSQQVSGGYGSARDTAALMEHIITTAPEVISATRHASLDLYSLNQALHRAENTNGIVRDIPGLIASKTGFTDLAGGNIVIAFDAGLNHPIVIAILGSTEEGRFRDVQKLVAASVAALR